MPDRSAFGPWVRRFLLEHLVGERNLARNTQESYRDALRLLLPFAAAQLKAPVDRLLIEDVSADLVRAFLANLEEARGCTVRTRNQRLGALHALARFIGERSPEHVEWSGHIRAIPFKRTEHIPLTYLEKEEIQALLDAPDRKTQQGHRDYAVLLFLYNSGARASEAAQVTIGDLDSDFGGGGTVKLRGKGSKTRVCPLWARTMTELFRLTQDRAEGARLFVNRYGDPITRFGIHTLVERHVRLAARNMRSLLAKRVSPHTIRHTTATHLLRAGVDINTIRAWLGHVSVDTTTIYADTDLATKAKALAACDPSTGTQTRKSRWRDDPGLMEFLRSL
jgi:integrase/recombinase XerD